MSVLLTTQLVSIGLMSAPVAAAPALEQPAQAPASAAASADTPAPPPAQAAQPADTQPTPAEPAPAAPEAPPPSASEAAAPVPAQLPPGDHDPFEKINRFNYAVNKPIDKFIIRPVALTYKKVVPEPIRDGARNIINTIYEPVVVVNDILQLRPGRAVRTVARVLVNVTVGLAGLFDMAKRKPFHLPHHNNGFADTLGYYGFKGGPYLYLPVLGPTNLRDGIGAAGDYFAQPRILGFIAEPSAKKPIFNRKIRMGTYGTVITIVGGIDTRAQADAELTALERSSVDPYAALRSSYLQSREAEINELKTRHGQAVKVPAFDDPLADPAATPAAPAAPAPPAPATPTPAKPAG
ncbi:MAG TPA: VacJ family lipoprotein [Novosphingobium sp.]|nr:VacJ family lipoprotein [Novosphingobium sp.]